MENQVLAKSIKIFIQNGNETNEYTITYPKVGNIIDIENRKMLLSNNRYSHLVQSELVGAALAADMIEIICVMGILIPDLLKDLRVDSIIDLGPIEMKNLIKVYRNDIAPWYYKWIEEFKDLEEPHKPQSENKDEEIK